MRFGSQILAKGIAPEPVAAPALQKTGPVMIEKAIEERDEAGIELELDRLVILHLVPAEADEIAAVLTQQGRSERQLCDVAPPQQRDGEQGDHQSVAIIYARSQFPPGAAGHLARTWQFVSHPHGINSGLEQAIDADQLWVRPRARARQSVQSVQDLPQPRQFLAGICIQHEIVERAELAPERTRRKLDLRQERVIGLGVLGNEAIGHGVAKVEPPCGLQEAQIAAPRLAIGRDRRRSPMPPPAAVIPKILRSDRRFEAQAVRWWPRRERDADPPGMCPLAHLYSAAGRRCWSRILW
jgi:hypothetical protein